MSTSDTMKTNDSYSFMDYLNPVVFEDSDLMTSIGQRLKQGKMVVINNAFKAVFAESLYNSLDGIVNWPLNHDYSIPRFQYHHHNIFSQGAFTDELVLCDKVFNSPESRKFIENLSGCDCSERTNMSPSWYKPGDYSTPHNDIGDNRTVAYVWHLTKNWQPTWGGDLFWCNKPLMLPPMFNAFSIFNVSNDSMHFVMPVSPDAKTKRLAINGWFRGKSDIVNNKPFLRADVIDNPRRIMATLK